MASRKRKNTVDYHTNLVQNVCVNCIVHLVRKDARFKCILHQYRKADKREILEPLKPISEHFILQY